MLTTGNDGLLEAIIDIREEDALEIVDSLLQGGADPAMVIETCREAMAVIGRRFESGDAFIPELIMAGEIMSGISAKVKPHLRAGGSAAAGRGCVVLGTVKGDIHDIGKDIVGSLLEASGFQVVDLGVDVPAESVVAAVRDNGECIVALSCLLTTGFDSMKTTIEALDRAGLRAQARIMVGGAPITAQVCDYACADAWGADAATALRLADQWTAGGVT